LVSTRTAGERREVGEEMEEEEEEEEGEEDDLPVEDIFRDVF